MGGLEHFQLWRSILSHRSWGRSELAVLHDAVWLVPPTPGHAASSLSHKAYSKATS